MNLSKLRINKTMAGRKKVEKWWREDERGRMIERRENKEGRREKRRKKKTGKGKDERKERGRSAALALRD